MYKRHFDSKGQEHDILVTKDLFLAMRILGLDPEKWISAKTVEDIINFISASELFDPSIYKRKLNHKHKSTLQKRSVQRYMYEKLGNKEKQKENIDHEEYLQKGYPEILQTYTEAIDKIEDQNKINVQLNGESIMSVFNLKPGHEVGHILKFIKTRYPESETITPEILEDVATNFYFQTICWLR